MQGWLGSWGGNWVGTQSKELVEGLQKLVQHFDARGLPVAGSGPRSSM
jgi:hypothetical protein